MNGPPCPSLCWLRCSLIDCSRGAVWPWWMQNSKMHSEDSAVVPIHCALGILDCLLTDWLTIFCHHLKCLLRWMGPCRVCEWMSPRSGQYYKLPDKRVQGELISKLGDSSLTLCRTAEVLHPFCISVLLGALGQVRDTYLRIREPLSLHQPTALNEHDWLWYRGIRSQDSTAGLVRIFVIQFSPGSEACAASTCSCGSVSP